MLTCSKARGSYAAGVPLQSSHLGILQTDLEDSPKGQVPSCCPNWGARTAGTAVGGTPGSSAGLAPDRILGRIPS